MISVDAYLWMLENQYNYTDPVEMAKVCSKNFLTNEHSDQSTPVELIRFAQSLIVEMPVR